MKKFTLGLVLMLMYGFSQATDSTFTITGKLDKLKSGKVFLSINRGNVGYRDSAVITNGKFEFKGTQKDPASAVLTLSGKRGDYLQFFVEPANITISGAGDSLKLWTVGGSKVNDDDKILVKKMEAVTKWEDANSKIYDNAFKDKNKPLMDSLDEVDLLVMAAKRKVVAEFVKENPKSQRGILAIQSNFAYYAEATDVEPIYKSLDKQLQQSAKGLDIKKMIETYKKVAIGQVPPDFTQTSPDGKEISLSSMKGKYTLVDFWASWCGPCRRENPNIVKNYAVYHPKGFEIFGVSYDTKKENWEKAIKTDELNWFQVSDLLGWKNATSDMYGIKAIPSNLLLDKNGVIIAKNLFGKKLQAKLAELFPNAQAIR